MVSSLIVPTILLSNLMNATYKFAELPAHEELPRNFQTSIASHDKLNLR